jgi:two-component system alkaline phosphatase synthesis response regulator PhoP
MAENNKKKKKILIVEDDPDFVAPIKLVLESENYRVDVASDGVQALEKVKAEKPNLIILDIVMDKKDGFQVCSELKGNREYSDIPVIVVTAISQQWSSTNLSREMGLNLEAEDFLQKPVDPAKLLQLVKKYLGKRKK